MSRQLDWDRLAHDYVASLVRDHGYEVPEGDLTVGRIAERNGIAPHEIARVVRQWLTSSLWQDHRLCQEFRLAVTRLCVAQLEPGIGDVDLTYNVRQWLRGELRLLSGVRDALIFQRISRSSARDMLFSLGAWLPGAGPKGMALIFDVSRYIDTKPSGADPSSLYYGTSAVLDLYETLRQFIDATDEMQSTLLVVIAPGGLTADERRAVSRYPALLHRISEEVRDRRRANPLSTLVRVGT